MKRTILVVVIGYILGIIWGQYLKISIVPLYILITTIYIIYTLISKKSKKLKVFSIHRYFRYLKIFINLKIILTICISSAISFYIVENKNKERNQIQEIYMKSEKISGTAKIVSGKIDKNYKIKYEIEFKNKSVKNKFYIDIKKNNTKSNQNNKKINEIENNNQKSTQSSSEIDIENLKYGDTIYIEGDFTKPEIQRNFKGFDYNEYLKQKEIIGTINIENIQLIKSNEKSIYYKIQDYIENIKNEIYNILSKDEASIFIGIVFGDKSNISEEIIQNFKKSSLSHVLAVSGMNITFLIILTKIFNKSIGKKITYIISILFIIVYMIITGFSASIFRAGIMGIMMLVSKIIYRKNDIWVSMATSLLILLIINPFLIFDIGLQLSYGGTIGILLFQKIIFEILKAQIYKIKKIKYHKTKKQEKIISKIVEILSVTISAQIIILPILIYTFNTISTYFIISNFLVSIIIEPLFIISIIFLFLLIFLKPLAYFFSIFIELGYNFLIEISNIGNLPHSEIIVNRPYFIIVLIYTLIIITILFYYNLKQNKLKKAIFLRFKNIKAWGIYKIKLKKKFFIIIILIILIFSKFYPYFIKSNLQIFFIDVGQGDSSLIITPQNKKILIDGGGSTYSNFDVGNQTLLPYLLNRRIKKLDIIIISHFDQDHVGGILAILEKIKVKEIIISKQFEITENYESLLRIVKDKNIKLKIAKKNDKLDIEKDIYIDILWPEEEPITENIINNNALVAKLNYNNFSILFTGDIEKIAEEKILQKIDRNHLKSTILKVAHHGSKSSSIEEFIKEVKPQIGLIGVGKNNLFGHPNEKVIERLEAYGTKIYRTDKNGEISLVISKKGKIKIKEMIE